MGYTTVVTTTPPTGVSANLGNTSAFASQGFNASTSIPTVVDYTPTTTESANSLLPDIGIRFNLPMAVGQTIALGDLNGATAIVNQYMILSAVASDETFQLDAISYDTYTDTLVVRPQTELTTNTTYAMTVLAGMPDTVGRKVPRAITWLFSTTTSTLATPIPTSPLDAQVEASAPICTWTCATTGVTFDYQLSTNPVFSSISYSVTGLNVLQVGPLTSEQVLDNTTYYWRTRAVSGTVEGDWCDLRSFRVEPPASTAIVRTIPSFDVFTVSSQTPQVGRGNFSDWPTCTITFSDTIYTPSIPSGIAINAVDVDTGASTSFTAFTTGASGKVLTLTFTEDITSNTNYVITVSSIISNAGASLTNDFEMSFTSSYAPLYVDYSTLISAHGEYGAFFARYTQEEINKQLHRASIRCNRLLLGETVTALNSLRTPTTATYDMMEYVMAMASYSLIQDFQYKLLTEADRRMQIDTLVEAVGTDILKQITAILKQLKGDVDKYAMIIAGTIVKPVSGVRSSSWDPATMETDTSVAGILKGNF